jgi:integrase
MTVHPKHSGFDGGKAADPNLQHVLDALEWREGLSATRRRDLRSAVTRVAALMGDDPKRIPLNLSAIRVKLVAVNPIAAGMSVKTLQNLRSAFLAAISASGLTRPRRLVKALNADWTIMLSMHGKRARIGLAKLARCASTLGISPEQIDDSIIADLMAEVRDSSLHRNPNRLHRMIAQVWNEVAFQSGGKLQPVTVPSFRRPPQRIEWSALSKAFRRDGETYLNWCAGEDLFAADARARPLSPRTIRLRRDQILAGTTALLASGVKVESIRSLADLVTPKNFKAILRQRYEGAGGDENIFNNDLAATLMRIAREWVKLDTVSLVELRRLAARLPRGPRDLTKKNRDTLRQFDDPAALQRLFSLSGQLWDEVKRAKKPNNHTLCKAQAALAVAILPYMPIRLWNLVSLTFDVHLFMREGARAISTLEIPAEEVKNHRVLAFDIPPVVAKMLIEYRNTIAPKIIGRRPDKVFVNVDGSPKAPQTVALLIRTALRKRAGLELTPHQFRHLAARILLDAEPGNFETVRQALGHASLNTTTAAYTGIDTRRAARHYHRIIEQTLESATPKTGKPKGSKPKGSHRPPPKKPRL